MKSIEGERVRRRTAPEVNQAIDDTMVDAIYAYSDASEDQLNDRIEELDREWDIERWLEMNASSLALCGLGLGVTVNRKWLALSATVLGFLLLHATQGWCPPVPMLRRLGVRTRSEIDRELIALKFLRGDFDQVPGQRGEMSVSRLVRALEA